MSRSLLPSDTPRSDVNRSDMIETARDALAHAREAFENKNYSDAEALALEVLHDSEPLNQPSLWTSARLLLAEALMKQQKYDDALKHLHSVLAFFESNGDQEETRHTLSLLGKVAYFKKNYPLALEYFQSVLTMCEECLDEFSYTANHFSGIIYTRQLDHQKAIESNQRGLLCAEALNSQYKIAQTLVNLGIVYMNRGDLVEAVSKFRQAESISITCGFSEVESIALQNLATVFMSVGDIEQSLTIHHRLIEHYERIGDKKLLGYECNNTGRSYFISNKIDLATHFCERAVEIFSALGEEDLRALPHLTLAEIYLKQGQYARAVSLNREIVSVYEASASKEFLADAYFGLGDSLYKSGDVQNAIIYLKKAAELCHSAGNFPRYAIFCVSLAEVLHAEQDTEAALSYFESARSICEQQAFNSLLPKIYLGLSKIYDERGDLRKAYDFYRKYHESSQAIFNLDVEKTTQRLSIQYDLRQKEQETKKEREKNEMLSKINQELQEANRLKNEFLSIAAHDLKNPLQSILGFADITQESHTTLEEAKAYAQIISRSASHMVNLVKSLLETAAISSNALTFELTEANLNDLLKKVIDDFQPTLQAKSQNISFHAMPNALALIDIEKMRDVFSNLISNAIKYSPASTSITVQIAPSAHGRLVVSVKDEGQGLSEKDKEKLFSAFQRLSSRPTGGESSTGLGLWIAKEFVEKHNGKIWAESEGKGKGTTFFVELPAIN